MKLSIKVIYALCVLCFLIALLMYADHSEGAGVPLVIGIGLAILATYKHLTDYPGK